VQVMGFFLLLVAFILKNFIMLITSLPSPFSFIIFGFWFSNMNNGEEKVSDVV